MPPSSKRPFRSPTGSFTSELDAAAAYNAAALELKGPGARLNVLPSAAPLPTLPPSPPDILTPEDVQEYVRVRESLVAAPPAVCIGCLV